MRGKGESEDEGGIGRKGEIERGDREIERGKGRDRGRAWWREEREGERDRERETDGGGGGWAVHPEGISHTDEGAFVPLFIISLYH